DPSNRKSLPSIVAQASQVVQDFGTGSFLLWPLLNIGKDIDKSWSDPPRFRVFLTGAILLLLGWALRRVASSKRLPTPYYSHYRPSPVQDFTFPITALTR